MTKNSRWIDAFKKSDEAEVKRKAAESTATEAVKTEVSDEVEIEQVPQQLAQTLPEEVDTRFKEEEAAEDYENSPEFKELLDITFDDTKLYAQYGGISMTSYIPPPLVYITFKQYTKGVVVDGAAAAYIPPPLVYISELTLPYVNAILGTSICHDTVTRLILLLLELLNYTDSDQQNAVMHSTSSTGKTYLVEQTIAYLPQEDVEVLGYVSPKSFFWGRAKLVLENGELLQDSYGYIEVGLQRWGLENPRPTTQDKNAIKAWESSFKREEHRIKEEWEELPKFWLVDLEKKIKIFLDQPHYLLLEPLRPMMSHDRRIIDHQITDKTTSGANKTKYIKIRGYPTFIFCTALSNPNEQEKTRNFFLSPETDQNKIKDSLELQSKMLADRSEYIKELEQNPHRKALRAHIRAIKETKIDVIKITEDDRKYVLNSFISKHKQLAPRAMRDMPRVFALIKAIALLNCFSRERNGNTIIATHKDVVQGMALAEKLIDANELGLTPFLYDFFIKTLKPYIGALGAIGLSRRGVQECHENSLHYRIGNRDLNAMIDTYLEAGLLIEEVDSHDKRTKKLFLPELYSQNVEEEI